MKIYQTIGLALLSILLHAAAHADITFFTNRTDFEAAAGSLVTETFESANVADGGVGAVEGPINSMSDNAVFSPGDIVTGMSTITFPSASGEIMPVLGQGVLNGTTKMVGTQFSNAGLPNLALRVTFDPGASAVGADLFAADNAGDSQVATANVDVFDTNGNSIGFIAIDLALVDGGFFGAISDESIGGFLVRNSAFTEFMDNVSFRAATVPEPATGLVLLGCFGALIGVRRKKL